MTNLEKDMKLMTIKSNKLMTKINIEINRHQDMQDLLDEFKLVSMDIINRLLEENKNLQILIKQKDKKIKELSKEPAPTPEPVPE